MDINSSLRSAAFTGATALVKLASGETLKAVKKYIEESGHESHYARAMRKGRKADFSQAVNLSLQQVQIGLKEKGEIATISATAPRKAISLIARYCITHGQHGLLHFFSHQKSSLSPEYISALYNAFFHEATILLRSTFNDIAVSFSFSTLDAAGITIEGATKTEEKEIKEILQIVWECGDWHAIPVP